MTAAEPTDELREAIRDELGGWPIGSGYYQYTVGIDDAAEMADALLSGPLAPLLAKLRAVEDLADRLRDESRYLDPFTARVGVAERIREALDAS